MAQVQYVELMRRNRRYGSREPGGCPLPVSEMSSRFCGPLSPWDLADPTCRFQFVHISPSKVAFQLKLHVK